MIKKPQQGNSPDLSPLVRRARNYATAIMVCLALAVGAAIGLDVLNLWMGLLLGLVIGVGGTFLFRVYLVKVVRPKLVGTAKK